MRLGLVLMTKRDENHIHTETIFDGLSHFVSQSVVNMNVYAIDNKVGVLLIVIMAYIGLNSFDARYLHIPSSQLSTYLYEETTITEETKNAHTSR